MRTGAKLYVSIWALKKLYNMNIILGFLFIPKGWLYVILSDIFITYCNNYNEHISGGGLIALFGAHLIHYDGAGGLVPPCEQI